MKIILKVKNIYLNLNFTPAMSFIIWDFWYVLVSISKARLFIEVSTLTEQISENSSVLKGFLKFSIVKIKLLQ